MDNFSDRLTLEGAGGRMETDDTRWTFRPAIENFGVSRFKLAIRQPNYEFSKKMQLEQSHQKFTFVPLQLLKLIWVLSLLVDICVWP